MLDISGFARTLHAMNSIMPFMISKPVMGVLYAVEVVVAILIILLVLVQKSKSGGGLGAIAGGGATEEIFGTGGASALLKLTVFFCSIFFVTTLTLAWLQGEITKAKVKSLGDTTGTEESANPAPDDSKTDVERDPDTDIDTPDDDAANDDASEGSDAARDDSDAAQGDPDPPSTDPDGSPSAPAQTGD